MNTNQADAPTPAAPEKKRGLDHWAKRVAVLVEASITELSPYNVYKLRVALRNCRAIAKVLAQVGGKKEWRTFSLRARAPFKALGLVRDFHVLADVSKEYMAEGTDVGDLFRKWLSESERKCTSDVVRALGDFDLNGWRRESGEREQVWQRAVGKKRALARVARGFLKQAVKLHGIAAESGEDTDWHQARTGWKWVRYSVENFLPALRSEWVEPLKQIQDALGLHHDLSVLKACIVAFDQDLDSLDAELALQRIERECRRQLKVYRQLVGPDLEAVGGLRERLQQMTRASKSEPVETQEEAS